MARKNAPGTLIHCEACGEDYSATYKRCPFCGEKSGQWSTSVIPPITDNYEDDYVFEGGDVFDEEGSASSAPRGGKRLSDDAPGPINWPRLITFICSLIIIAAALVIVFSYIYPKIHNSSSDPDNSPPPSQSQPVESDDPGVPESDDPGTVETNDPGVTETGDPGDVTTEPVVTDDPEPSAPVSSGDVDSLKLNKTDFTLKPDESYTIQATVSPSDWDGTITWTSSNTRIATVSASGKVTNVNTSGDLLSVTITATAGDVTATAKVYCTGGSSGSSSSSGGETSSGTLKLNKSDFTLYVNGSGADKSTTMKATGVDSVTWSISDPSVATIDENGKVTAVSAGKAIITATAPDGSTATCIVRVRD